MSILNYQARVLGPTEVVDYATLVMQAYPTQAVQTEPFIGFRVLCRDANAFMTNPGERIRQIDANLGFLRGKGCIIRETKSSIMPDGFWIITFPVPRSQVNQQINQLLEVLATFEQFFGIVRHGVIEINVSGRCHFSETERCLSSLVIPPRYMSSLVIPDNTPYKLGNVIRINDNFILLRTRWNMGPQANAYEELVVLSQLMASMYR
jgi:hypothetical protein